MKRVPRHLLVGVMRGYQVVVSPLFGRRCRYYPSCSAYAVAALRQFGAVKGLGLAVWRVLRCNPWSRGGVDYVPGTRPEWSVVDDDGEVLEALVAGGLSTGYGSR
ncbi:MAG: membrane protein insertion efficiency factor YidD [Bifidobacteriaceae bacterium]|nr:membrane protein insertion efficiency factor YidD [Bifidobacteriaceae bacterium]